MKRQVVDRLFMSALCMGVIALALDAPGRCGVSEARDPTSWFAFGLLATTTFVTMLDTIINDLLPERYVFKTAWKYRQALWIFTGIELMCLSFVALKAGISPVHNIILSLLGFKCASISFIDLYYEQRDRLTGRKTTDFGDLHADRS